jgi:serine/threonine protein kinase
MSTGPEKVNDTLADQLAEFDDRLHATASDVDMLADIQEGIGSLLSSSDSSEAEIRRVLQERYEAGALRKETFQLVKSMLDRYGTENIPTSPTKSPLPAVTPPPAPTTPPSDEDSFGATTVIPTSAAPVNDPDARVQVGSVLRDRFLLQKKVSGGSMGVVYKALDRRLAEAASDQTSVAIKVLSPALAEDGHALRALQQEAAKTRCLVHPHIVRFIDLDRDDDLYFLILEWLEGRTLADILDSPDSKSIDREAAFRIVRQVGEALDYAHKCGIVHADVKPGNVMVMPNGDAKLFDFGVARVRQQHAETEFDPGVLGALTPAYSSLQVLGGEEPVAADDVFSLACLLYRLIAGYRVFGPRNAAEASAAGMQPQQPQGLSDEQWVALKKALSYSRVTRFASVAEFIDALGTPTPIPTHTDTITIEAPERFATDDGSAPGKWIASIVVLLGLAGIGANQMGYLDPWLERFRESTGLVDIAPPEEVIEEFVEDPIVEAGEVTAPASEEPVSEPEVAEVAASAMDAAAEDVMIESEAIAAEVTAEPDPEPEPVTPRSTLVDFSTLAPPGVIVTFAVDAPAGSPTDVTLREDGDPVIVDFIRGADVSSALTLRLVEVDFSGTRSPWSSGQYALSNAGLVVFPAGQQRARVTLRTASDPRREGDQRSTLRLQPNDGTDAQLALINVTIEDDDRRAFEQGLPANTVGFGTSQVSVSEADSAVQVDVMRFNPDDGPLEVGFRVEDLSATQGEDYFAPGISSISFGPGQRTARLLIPLVQDSRAEGDEAFVVKLLVNTETQPMNVSPNIAVMIRDDER